MSFSALIRQHIANALAVPDSDRLLVERIRQIAAQQPGAMPAEAIPQVVAMARNYVQGTPDLLDACAHAAIQAGVGGQVMPLLEVAGQYFLQPADAIPDHYGLYGLLDDAYMTQSLLSQISNLHLQLTGIPLLAVSLEGASRIIRGLIGEPVASQLDAGVAGTIQSAVVQQQLNQLSHNPASLGLQGSPTGGPGAWGQSWEDEMSRIGAECGISINW